MEIINIGDAKTNLSKLVEQVFKGEEVIIGRETNHWYAYLLSIKHKHTNVPCNCQISIKTHLTRFKLPRQSAYAKHGKNKLLNYILEKGLTEENFIQIDYKGRKNQFIGNPFLMKER